MRGSHIALTALLAIALLSVGLGAVSGQTTTEELYNQTTAVDNDTEEIYTDVTNSTANVTVAISGIDGSGTETEQVNQTVNPGAGVTETVNANVDATTYESYRVVVTGVADDSDAFEVNTLTASTFGGGGIGGLGLSFETIIAGAILILLAGGIALEVSDG